MSNPYTGSSSPLGPDAIQKLLRANINTPNALRIGAFVLTLDPASDHPYRNYAVPAADGPVTGSAVTDLVDAFRARSLVPRLEFVTPAPQLEQALLDGGFTIEEPRPVMAVTSESFQPPAGLLHIDVGAVADEPSLLSAANVQNAAYQVADATDADVNRLRRLVEAGGRVVLARVNGLPVGSGLSTAPVQGSSEVAAVGVLAEFRRQGVATAVAATLTQDLLGRRVAPFLQVEHPSEGLLYERLGYFAVAELIFATLDA